MALLIGTQIKDYSISLEKLNGTGMVFFSNGASMSFGTNSTLTVATVSNSFDVTNKIYVDSIKDDILLQIESLGSVKGITAGPGLIGGGTSSFITLEINPNSAGNGLTYSSGVFSVNVDSDSLEIINDIVRLKDSISGGRTFSNSVSISQNLTVDGDFMVNGTTTFVNTTELEVKDSIITISKGNDANILPTLKSGISVDRGLTASGGDARLLWDESKDVWISGLSGSEKVILNDVGDGLTQSNNIVSINLANNSGLTFSSNKLGVSVDGTTITIVNDQLVAVGGSSPIYQIATSSITNGNYSPTGIFLSSTPSDYSRIQISVNGQLIHLGASSSADAYFTKNLQDLITNDELYWNGIIAGYELDSYDKLQIVYET